MKCTCIYVKNANGSITFNVNFTAFLRNGISDITIMLVWICMSLNPVIETYVKINFKHAQCWKQCDRLKNKPCERFKNKGNYTWNTVLSNTAICCGSDFATSKIMTFNSAQLSDKNKNWITLALLNNHLTNHIWCNLISWMLI